MRKNITVSIIALAFLVFCLLPFEAAKAQEKSILEKIMPNLTSSAGVKRIPQMIENYRAAGAVFERRELFAPNARLISGDADLTSVVTEGAVFTMDKAAVARLMKENVPYLTLPVADGKGNVIELELARVNIFAPGFNVKTSKKTNEKNLEESYGIHYRGIIKGDMRSLASVSIFKNEVMGIFSTEGTGSIVLGRLGGSNPTDRHILYDDRNLKVRPNDFCDVETPGGLTLPPPAPQSEEEMMARCIRIYFEANYNLFQNKTTVAATVSYITGFFNQSATLIATTGVSVSLSEIFVWTSPSPYTGTDTLTQLNTFRTTRTTFNGNLAHLADLQNIGGRAYLGVACNPGFAYGVSGIFSTYSNVPTYSFTVQVISHELGHNLGSPHTHACAWNGNNTAIDGCFTVEGTCANPGLPGGGGTIMSYCYNTSAGVNFNLGYGSQPSNVILNQYNASTCLTDCAVSCTPSPINVNQTVNGNLQSGDCLYTDNSYIDTYTFNGTAGQQIYITMNSSQLNSYLFLYQGAYPGGTSIASDNDGGGGTNARIPSGSGFFTLPATGTYTILANSLAAGETGAYTLFLGSNVTPSSKKPFDFDGDSKTDIGIFRPSNGQWWIQRSSNNSVFAATFGNSADKIAPADYTGDGKTDIAFFRPSTNEWFILRSENGTYYSGVFGTSGDIPAPGDFDLDGKDDLVVFRPSTGVWYVFNSSNLSVSTIIFGQNGDIPVTADYDGDGRSDAAVFRPSTGAWWLRRSTLGIIAFQFGNSADKPAPGDYSGDGKADVAFFRPVSGEWYILRSENQTYYSGNFGANGDVPVPGDYDGDGKNDPAVFRPSNTTWYAQRSTNINNPLIQTFGIGGDKAVPSAFVP